MGKMVMGGILIQTSGNGRDGYGWDTDAGFGYLNRWFRLGLTNWGIELAVFL